jgi:hypothetical protein
MRFGPIEGSVEERLYWHPGVSRMTSSVVLEFAVVIALDNTDVAAGQGIVVTVVPSAPAGGM